MADKQAAEAVAWQVRNIGHEPLTWGLVTDADLVSYYRRHPERYELRGLAPIEAEAPNWTECCNMSPEVCDCVNPKHIRVSFAPASQPPTPAGVREITEEMVEELSRDMEVRNMIEIAGRGFMTGSIGDAQEPTWAADIIRKILAKAALAAAKGAGEC